MATVELKRSGNMVEAIATEGITSGQLHDLLRVHFKYGLKIRNDRRTASATGQKFRTDPRYLCQLRGSGVLFPAGLLHRCAGLFKQCSIQWELQDFRPQLLPEPRLDLIEVDKLIDRDDQQRALATVFTADMGVIEAPTGYGKTFMIEQMVRAYPTSRIIICTYRRDVVNSIRERLKPHVRFNEMGVVHGGSRRPNRVTVSTIGSLEHACVDKCRLFLYDEVHEAASEERMKKIGTIRNSRMFGLSASPRGRTDGADLAIEAMFGPVIYELSYQEASAAGNVAAIEVNMYRVPGASIPYDDDVAQFRYGIWRNDLRNQMIARAAAEHAMQNKQVLIMVDKVEHALAIKAKYLPQWPLVHGPVQAEQVRMFKSLGLLPEGTKWLCTQEQRDSYLKRFEAGKMRFAISTAVWSVGVNFRHLDALIRGDGGSAPIKSTQIPGRLSRGSDGLLIDFDDAFDERFRRRSEARLRIYRSKGWNVVYK